MLWNGYLDVNGLGRQFFKQAQVHNGFTIGFPVLLLAKIDKKTVQLIMNSYLIIFQPSTIGTKFYGLYHFWQSDMTVQRCPQWMASVKMH